MKTFFQFLILLIFLVAAFIIQDLLPAFSFLNQIHLLLVPVVFGFGMLILPFSSALLFALITGILQGLITQPFFNGHIEIGLGWFIFLFIGWAFLFQWSSILTGGVRWELHAIGSALCTATLLLEEFLILSIKRGHFSMLGPMLFVVAVSAASSFVIAPFFYYAAQFLLPPVKTQHKPANV